MWRTPFDAAMRNVRNHDDLNALLQAGRGYILNARTDRKKVHLARCRALEVMSTRDYPKVFITDAHAGGRWMNAEFGVGEWENCGTCGGFSMSVRVVQEGALWKVVREDGTIMKDEGSSGYHTDRDSALRYAERVARETGREFTAPPTEKSN